MAFLAFEKEIGGKKVWNTQLEEKVVSQLRRHGYENNRNDIEEQLRDNVEQVYKEQLLSDVQEQIDKVDDADSTNNSA